MTYNLRLFWRMAVRSFLRTSDTHGQLTPKRLFFVLLFYTVWPAWTLFTWACFLLDDLLFPAHKTQPLEKPLFIIGNYRSGSTFLHRLLSRDSHTFTSLRTWEIFITPTITQRKISRLVGKIDAFFGMPLKRLLHNVDRRGLGQIKIHRISLFEPEEDENILLHIWSTSFVGFMFPFLDEMPPYTFFDEALPAEEKQRIMGFYRSCVQRHLYVDGGQRHFVSKNPAFSAKIETLAEFFPDARILYLARNPLDMLPSTVSWLGYAWGMFGNPLEKYPYRPEILALARYWYTHPLKYLDTHPSPNHLILSYDDLIGDPERIIRGLYHQFGYPKQDNLEKIVAQAVAETRTYKSDHSYSYEKMGFSREQILADFEDIFARFGFETGIPAHPPAMVLEPPVPASAD
ncbi:MAG: hypothetical protein CVU44_00585 [Chloroflexi bacterium HGW-Chloroflexi-6]|nr:MAG: hypothetical protein CVU44_00585 [Chloroflexi bacterium HGW-Chloroflexi-6]